MGYRPLSESRLRNVDLGGFFLLAMRDSGENQPMKKKVVKRIYFKKAFWQLRGTVNSSKQNKKISSNQNFFENCQYI